MKKRELFLLALASGLLLAGCSDSKSNNEPQTPPPACEGVDLQTSNENCGTCGHKCGEHQTCISGTCDCANGWYDCNDDGICESDISCACAKADKQTSNEHCGECDHACVNAQCTGGECKCKEGWNDCDKDGNCETEGACECTKGQTQPCYTGDPSDHKGETTDQSGAVIKHRCRDGHRTCQFDDFGAHWSAMCYNEIRPSHAYTCDDPMLDMDCDGVPESQQDDDQDEHTICRDGQIDDCCDNAYQCSNIKSEDRQHVHSGQEDCKENDYDDNCNGRIDEGTEVCGAQTVVVDNTCKIKDRTCDNRLDTVKGDNASWSTKVLQSATSKGEAARILLRGMDLCMEIGTAESLGDEGGIIEYSLHKAGHSDKPVNWEQVNFLPGMKNKDGVVRVRPRIGENVVLLSSGEALDVASGVDDLSLSFDLDENDKDKEDCSANAVPEIFSRNYTPEPTCPIDMSTICDSAVLHVKLKAPKTATGFSFDFRFFSREYPFYVCAKEKKDGREVVYNDTFLAMVTDESGNAIIDTNGDGKLDDETGNIAFDSQGNILSINDAFFTVCAAPSCGDHNAFCSLFDEYQDHYAAKYTKEEVAETQWKKKHANDCPDSLTCSEHLCGTCADGYEELDAYYTQPYQGVGLATELEDDEEYVGKKGGGTVWLTTQAPIQGGQVFNLDFYIWDTGDTSYDSTVVLDNFQWFCSETVTVKTDFAQPIPQTN